MRVAAVTRGVAGSSRSPAGPIPREPSMRAQVSASGGVPTWTMSAMMSFAAARATCEVEHEGFALVCRHEGLGKMLPRPWGHVELAGRGDARCADAARNREAVRIGCTRGGRKQVESDLVGQARGQDHRLILARIRVQSTAHPHAVRARLGRVSTTSGLMRAGMSQALVRVVPRRIGPPPLPRTIGREVEGVL